jgi:hypothetical protein
MLVQHNCPLMAIMKGFNGISIYQYDPYHPLYDNFYIYIFSLKTIYYRGKENKHIANGQGYGYLCNEDILVFL